MGSWDDAGRLLLIAALAAVPVVPAPPVALAARAPAASTASTASTAGPAPSALPRPASAASPAAAPVRLRGYHISADAPRLDVDRRWWPYALSAPLAYDLGTRDKTGVAMYAVKGRLYNHPVGQASAGPNLLESYRVNHDAAYLARAALNAQRLVDTRVESRGGWFFPFPYRFALHRLQADAQIPPWYSAMAQGQAMSLFVRLYEVTGKASWRRAADKAFTALALPPGKPSQPYVSLVDANGQLWLEEFAKPVSSRNDRTWNGMIFAEYGLWDYYRLTRNADAKAMFSGVTSTVRRYTLRSIRRPGWISAYCLRHGVLNERYHATVTRQYRYLHAITGSSTFAVYQDLFFADYATSSVRGTVVLAAGRRTGYVFDSSGRILRRKTVTHARTSTAPGADRRRVKGRGYYYRITGGPLSGFRVLEVPGQQYLKGTQFRLSFGFPRRVTFPAGTTRGWTLSAAGDASGRTTVTYPRGSTATTERTALINGQLWVLVATGDFAGKYVPYDAVRVA
jgi:D-glucuronyl C5-epimerase-like protein